MNDFTLKAKSFLENTGCTLVFCKSGEMYSDSERGVKTLLFFINTKRIFQGFSVADKVVGKAAAFLYVLLGIEEIYAGTISESALSVLEENNVKVFYGNLVERIKNRDNTGYCPMETAVMDVTNPLDALVAIKETYSKLNS
ncbi:MAG: DUF1893 domain-containing protein [Ruminococcaceae bacterium]|nr:DUF1893 domain-containing protein [Oscillospiraceae bacterium]